MISANLEVIWEMSTNRNIPIKSKASVLRISFAGTGLDEGSPFSNGKVEKPLRQGEQK